MKVLLPKEIVKQKLDREKLTNYNALIKEEVTKLYNEGSGEFIVQDGEPYANGELHLGHLLNKTLKDFVVKYYLSIGTKVRIAFGWDCHGLPIETKAKQLEGDLLTNSRFIADKYCEIQNNTLELFGIYPTEGKFKTMDKDFIEREISLFNELQELDYIIKKDKPTWYSPTLKTVLANSEIEYKEFSDSSLFFTFNTVNDFKLLIWTTTEWTVKGNQAVCLNKEIEYVNSIEGICSKKFAIENNLSYLPIDISTLTSYFNHNNEVCPILFDDYVSDSKTGIVHICGGQGDDDFRVLIENNIVPKNVCDKEDLLEHIATYKVNEEYVFKREEYKHDYPIDWRNGDKVYKVLTEQTYLDFDLGKIKSVLKQIKLSSKDRNRLSTTIFSRKDWCISRQRQWGVKIPNSNNILDVWFDSGSTFLMYDKPVDLYIEGSDQHRGWFQSSILLAAMIERVPTKRIVTHGFILDDTRNKLSKSQGNGSSLELLYDTYNPDVLRLWVLLSDFKNDIVFSYVSVKNAGKQYFKIRNFMRYLINNLHINNYDVTTVNSDLLNKVDTLKTSINTYVDNMEFNKVVRSFIDFIHWYSSTLTEEIKNTFYESDISSSFRIKYETEFYFLSKELTKILFPILPFLSMELKQTYETLGEIITSL